MEGELQRPPLSAAFSSRLRRASVGFAPLLLYRQRWDLGVDLRRDSESTFRPHVFAGYGPSPASPSQRTTPALGPGVVR
jgi:hypothetical protein